MNYLPVLASNSNSPNLSFPGIGMQTLVPHYQQQYLKAEIVKLDKKRNTVLT
jgi:hypothetical protein